MCWKSPMPSRSCLSVASTAASRQRKTTPRHAKWPWNCLRRLGSHRQGKGGPPHHAQTIKITKGLYFSAGSSRLAERLANTVEGGDRSQNDDLGASRVAGHIFCPMEWRSVKFDSNVELSRECGKCLMMMM